MTSTVDLRPPAAHPSWLRTGLVVAVLALFATQSPGPWGGLWLVVPVTAAISLLLAWRFGSWGVLASVALIVAAWTVSPRNGLWVWWIPAASLSGVWMGLREEGGGPSTGVRAWMLLPLLIMAVALPWLPQYGEWVKGLEQEFRRGDHQFVEVLKGMGVSGVRLASMERTVVENAKVRQDALPFLIPTALFVWIGALVMTGRLLAGRWAGLMRWPALSRGRLSEWRLPDGAIWLFLAGLALTLLEWKAAAPAGWTLLLNAGLGFCIQGIAVVESLLLARGVPPAIIMATLVFVFVLAMPVFMLTTVAVGLSDVWLDYRRMEAPPDSENT